MYILQECLQKIAYATYYLIIFTYVWVRLSRVLSLAILIFYRLLDNIIFTSSEQRYFGPQGFPSLGLIIVASTSPSVSGGPVFQFVFFKVMLFLLSSNIFIIYFIHIGFFILCQLPGCSGLWSNIPVFLVVWSSSILIHTMLNRSLSSYETELTDFGIKVAND